MIKKITIFLIILSSFYTNMLAEDMSDIPQESEVFYTEELPTSLLMSKKISRASSRNSYKVTTTILNCFDESRINTQTNAWFVTSDGSTQLSINLQFTEDDDRYTIASYEISSYFYEGDNLFQDDSKELITDVERFVGKYEPTNTEKTITVKWTAPEVFPYTTSPYYTFYMVIKVNFKNGGIAYVGKNLGVSRTGILLLHGLNDTKKVFEPFREYLISSGAFIGSQIYNMCYEETNTSSFDENTKVNKVVEKGLNKLSESLYDAKIVSTKYDMIGHSMGGILERKYIQDVDSGHTYRLITLNTPHYGAPLGNVAPTLFGLVNVLSYTSPVCNILKVISDLAFNPNGGRQAVSDLAIGSNAINDLNSSSASRLIGIPVFAVGTYLSDIEENDYSYTCPTKMTGEAAYLMSHIFYNDVPRKRYSFLLDDIVGDGIVSLESQRGGLNDFYCSMFCDDYNLILLSNAFHCNSPKWSVTQNEMRLLLLSEPDANIFCMTGFKESPTSASAKKMSRATDTSSEYIETYYCPLKLFVA